jgi:hypothetical protein
MWGLPFDAGYDDPPKTAAMRETVPEDEEGEHGQAEYLGIPGEGCGRVASQPEVSAILKKSWSSLSQLRHISNEVEAKWLSIQGCR